MSVNIEIKYAIGDKVQYYRLALVEVKCTCSCCGGTGKITGVDSKEYECGECDGKGYTVEEKRERTLFSGIINGIKVYWNRGKKPYVVYKMEGWNLSYTEIAEDEILGPVLNDDSDI